MARHDIITRTLRCNLTRLMLPVILVMLFLSGCSTRQVSNTLEGSTAQRLVTYSLEKFVVELADQPELTLKNKRVHLNLHFLQGHPMIDYAQQLLAVQLELVHGIQVSAVEDPADFQIDVFFNSLGTDVDNFGLTVPTFGLLTTADSRLEVLALDMFHGVTEGHAIVKPEAGGEIRRTKRILTRIRRDNVSTPIVEFPLNQLD